jgi:hypothetical protein
MHNRTLAAFNTAASWVTFCAALNYLQPTCGDVDLDREGAQQFSGCAAPFFFDSSKTRASPPSVSNCCVQVRAVMVVHLCRWQQC